MLTRVYMKWAPLLVIYGGTGIFFHLLRACRCLCCHCCSCQTDKINYKFSGGDWARGRPQPFFEIFASALLAGI